MQVHFLSQYADIFKLALEWDSPFVPRPRPPLSTPAAGAQPAPGANAS
jgi:hypothetical protein